MLSVQLVDELDALSLRFINSYPAPPQIVEWGGRLGAHTKRMSAAGGIITMIDRIDLPADHFTRFGHDGELFGKITHLQADFMNITEQDLPPVIDIIYSQRALNYLPYAAAYKILEMQFKKLADTGAIFLSMAGAETEYGLTHAALDKPIVNRFDHVSKDMQNKHNMPDKICVYSQAELKDMLTAIGFSGVSTMQSGFGNVKAIGYKNPLKHASEHGSPLAF